MIRFDADAARVQLHGAVGGNAFATDVVLTRREPRRLELNGERLGSSDRLRQELTTLVFTPDRLAVVKGGPATRRAYLDRVVVETPALPRGCLRRSTRRLSVSETPACAAFVPGSRRPMP